MLQVLCHKIINDLKAHVNFDYYTEGYLNKKQLYINKFLFKPMILSKLSTNDKFWISTFFERYYLISIVS